MSEAMNFGQALEALKAGKKVSRAGWKNAWVTDSNMRESRIQVPNFVEIPISFKNDGCHHTERLADPYCEGCRDRGGKVNV